jgi:acylphosphatase
MHESWRIRVTGRVQGVGYRDACVGRARALGLTGWVRNRSDATVEALLQGTPDQLEDMLRWMRSGIATARVDDHAVQIEPSLERLRGFERLPTE